MDDGIRAFYDIGDERDRLSTWAWLEFARTKSCCAGTSHLLPRECWMSVAGRERMPCGWPSSGTRFISWIQYPCTSSRPLRQPGQRAVRSPSPTGDARSLSEDASSFDAVLLLGPLYHLIRREERVAALAEARRVVVGGGVMAAAGISRFASIIDGLARGLLLHPEFQSIVEKDLRSGEHRNPTALPRERRNGANP